ncbi:MAG: hemolysin family protein [Bacteroidota bacterium]|nr:hemolysin family protein [Bacteroidota bacterium]
MIISDLIIFVCLLLSAFFSGMEIAFVSSNKIYLEVEKKQTGINAKFLNFITKNSSRFIATMLLGNNISLVIYGIFMGDRIIDFLFPSSALTGDIDFKIFFIQTLISTLIILITAEFIPKVFFNIYANASMKFFAFPAMIFYIIFIPLTHMIIKITDFILMIFFNTKVDQAKFSFSKIELGDYIDQQLKASDNKENLDSEIEIFQKALDFSDLKTREVMVPRTEIIAVELNSSMKAIKNLFTKTGLSKILVYRKTIDNIIGYVHAFEIFKNPNQINSILLPVGFVPETMLISVVLKTLIKQRKSIAIVLDEYGGTSGIITVEDIIEELFGEIEDEHDKIELFEKIINDNEYEFSARLEVDYLNRKYNLKLPVKEFYETLGGLIVDITEEIPKKGQKIDVGSCEIEIKSVLSTKIDRVILKIIGGD